jgi:hypothetical protein
MQWTIIAEGSIPIFPDRRDPFVVIIGNSFIYYTLWETFFQSSILLIPNCFPVQSRNSITDFSFFHIFLGTRENLHFIQLCSGYTAASSFHGDVLYVFNKCIPPTRSKSFQVKKYFKLKNILLV